MPQCGQADRADSDRRAAGSRMISTPKKLPTNGAAKTGHNQARHRTNLITRISLRGMSDR